MILLVSIGLPTPLHTYALPLDRYADASVLSTGRWARVKVSQSGMHVITDADMRKLGFNDPSKVRVYGTGGRQVSDALGSTTFFDLPLIPSVRTEKGIVFFASDNFKWSPGSSPARPYTHRIHAFSDECYYFISDIEADDILTVSTATSADASGTPVTEFTARTVHEKELEPAGDSGSQVFGEDFRSARSQTFNLKLPGRVGNTDAAVLVRFAAKVTNGASNLVIKANGKALPTAASDRIAGTQSSYYTAVTETSKTVTDGGESLDIGIEYSQTGVLFKARLDYIEAFYTRKLALDNGELHFYGTYRNGDVLSVAGSSANTVIWDVTDPAAIRKVDYRLNGDNAAFRINESGYREFVAFNPASITRAAVNDGTVANQNLHGLETPDMVIITQPAYREGAEKIARMHEQMDGFRVHVVNTQEIYNEFSGGKQDVGAFRKLLKMWYDRGTADDGHSLRYCLLMGKPSYDHKMLTPAIKSGGYLPMPIYQSYDGFSEETSYSCDDYIAMLDDVEEGKFNINSANIRVSVGRLPVTSAAQSLQMAAKIEKYARDAELGIWRNRVMMIADDDDNGAHLNQSETAYQAAIGNGNGASFVYDRLYLDSYRRVMTTVGATYPQATERMMRNYDDGVLFTSYIGHASETNWGHEHLWEWPSINSMTNKNLTFMYAATCSFAFWDKPDYSGGEVLMLNPEAGVIGMIAASRKVYVDRNGPFSKSIMTHLFKYDGDGNALRFGDAYLLTRNDQRLSNSLRYMFMGDPALRIPNPSYKVNITSINGKAVGGDNGDLPELRAMSAVAVEGEILRGDGSLADDYNGTVNLQLYDGERVITTFGQGTSGVSISYNDRDSRLAMSTAKVKDGRWTATLRVPPEIQGLYTKAMISAYAWNDLRIEANGNTTDLYVYGYNDNESEDTDGPTIEYFYVNTPNFQSGDVVNSNSVILARMSDESGINISDSGIGHSMTLTVDEKDIYSDLNSYFTLDSDAENTGVLMYPLSGIAPGRHTLTLSVWDNANNVSKSSVEVNIGAAIDPVIYGITASNNQTSIDFRVELDRPNTAIKCEAAIFDLGGRRIWSVNDTFNSDMQSNITTSWNLCDAGGTRVDRGIYIYRVTVETPEGTYTSKSKKIAVSAAQ